MTDKNKEMQKSQDKSDKTKASKQDFLVGQLLIAMPNMEDTRFAQTLVFLCNHTDDGAMGLIINKTYPELSFLEVTSQLGLLTDDIRHDLPNKTLFYGGPVDPGRGFVLHSPDFYHEDYTQPLGDDLALTASIDIIEAIAHKKGPKKSLIMLGYAGWTKGQLEVELSDNSWLHCPATTELLFTGKMEDKYDKALKSIGISKDFLSMKPGHA